MDVLLQYNQSNRCCDVVFNGTDFALDATPASAMLFSLCADRRAKPDDILPMDVTDWANPFSFTARRGWCLDFLSNFGTLVGSRLWLLVRRAADEQTRIDCATYVAEALAWLPLKRGLAVQSNAWWYAPGILAYRARAGSTTVQLKRAL